MARVQAIGDRLREARMRQGMDITEVESATKIRAKYLRAIENDEFAQLPGHTFVRSFLRTYAEHVGLDPHLIVQQYRDTYEPVQEETQQFAPRRVGPGDNRRRRRSPGPGFAFAALLVALMSFLLVLGLTGDESGDGESTTAARTTTREERPARTTRRRERRRAPERPTRVSLIVNPVEPTYLCVDDGSGEVSFDSITSERQRFRGRRLRINLGRPSTEVHVNGDRVRIPAGANPVGYDFRPGRRPRPIPLGQRPCGG